MRLFDVIPTILSDKMYTHSPYSGPRSWESSKVDSTPQYSELYFSYSSNLSPQTMKGRHPHSLFAGLGVLKGWRWNVNSLQYGNIVPSSNNDVVYGALYFITPQDEAGLDDMEGAPVFYQKQHLEVTRINADGSETDQRVEPLIYIDSERPDEGEMAPEYVVWIRRSTFVKTRPMFLSHSNQAGADTSSHPFR